MTLPERPDPAARVFRTEPVSLERDLLLDPGDLAPGRHVSRRLAGTSEDRLRWRGEAIAETLCLNPDGVTRVREALRAGHVVVLESDAFEPVVRAVARRLSIDRYVCRRVEIRDGKATGRVLPDLHLVRLDEATRPAPVFLSGAVPAPWSVRDALAGQRILISGATGFIGKVWLAQLLSQLPELGGVTLMLRARGQDPEARLAQMIASPVFAEVPADARAAVRAVAGDLARPDLGLSGDDRRHVVESTDLVINCAGLTEFNPDPRDALAVNVDGPLRLLELAREAGAAFLHVSTCFVAGGREGRVAETLDGTRTPFGLPLDATAERERLARQSVEGPRRRELVRLARDRARELGWPNVYTFTKSLGETLVAERRGDVPLAIARPAIVETSAFSSPGWNEGINTSAPLAHLLGTAFRQLPVNERKRLDVIPVDLLCRGMTIVAAALLEGRAPLVTQLATSATNPLNLERAVELTALAHRRFYRQGRTWRERVLGRLEATPVSRARYENLSAPRQLAIVRGLNRAIAAVTPGRRAPLASVEKRLRRATELIELYEPFLLDHEPVFEADHVATLFHALSEEEQVRFPWNPEAIDWYDYWIHVHIPALRRWAYPLIERRGSGRPKPVETSREKPATPAGVKT
ncbi:MAG: SDR family oxidoreductase [Gemmatimonadetes bacterium]|nr:SDR family oxidoreductase [Gemmatimonadota bacterium]